ncbi:MAG: CYTH and CHAD domain-containing protein [Rugosibacter sp.]
MAKEVELKLTLAEKEQQRFLRHPLLKKAVHRQTETLDNIYYDTPDLALRRYGIALRLRRHGKHWLQTVKLAGTAAAGLASRPEWEVPYAGRFDFSAVTEKKVRTWLQHPRLLAQLAPIFETRFQRQTWRFTAAPGAVLLTLDRGWITAGEERTEISEVELELDHAPLNALFDLALPLTESLALTPAVRSKAERGYQLHSNTPWQPVKATKISILPYLSPLAAFRTIALACLEHLQQNHYGALHTEDPEYIHQMRVAMRRLRAALRIFSPLLPTRFTSVLKDAFTPLMVLLGQVRDLDVLYAEIAAPVLAAMANKPRNKDRPPLASLLSAIDQQRQHARQQAMALLDSPAYGHALLTALQALNQQETSATTNATTSATKLPRFAAKRLRSTSKNVSRRIRSIDYENPASLHDLRIAIKRLRYALDFFSSLTTLKNLQPILPQLIPLQETLGQLNDLSQAGKWLMAYAGEDTSLREAVTLIGHWHGKHHAQLLASLPLALQHLEKAIGNI